MRIAIATAVYHPMINGVAVFSYNLARGLKARGNEVMVLCPSQNGKNHVEMIDGVKTVFLKSLQAKVYPDQIHAVPEKKKMLYKHGFWVSVFPAREIREALDEFQPDVVHVQVSDPIGISAVSYAKKHNIPVVTTEHNQSEVITEPLHVPKIVKKPIDALLSAYFLNRQSKSDFVTMPTKQAIMHLLHNRKFSVPVAAVSNGVDLSAFKPGKVREEIYERYGLPKKRPIILYVGRVDPEKKVGLVLGAFAKVLNDNKFDKMSKPFLAVVGDGVDKVRLEQKYTKLVSDGDVKFVGKVLPPDLYEIYKTGTLFATASEIETQGIVLIEAAASGLPLIAVDKGAVSEICVNNENGFLCEPGNVMEITEAMKKILLDTELQEKFAKKSIELAHEHDFEKTLDKFMNIYERVCQKM